MQISVQIGLNWNWPTGTELGNINVKILRGTTRLLNLTSIRWRMKIKNFWNTESKRRHEPRRLHYQTMRLLKIIKGIQTKIFNQTPHCDFVPHQVLLLTLYAVLHHLQVHDHMQEIIVQQHHHLLKSLQCLAYSLVRSLLVQSVQSNSPIYHLNLLVQKVLSHKKNVIECFQKLNFWSGR